MLRALDLHFRQLLNPRAQPTGRTPPYPVGFDSLVSALCDQLHALAGPAESRAVVEHSSRWHSAAVAVGAAGDLLATHARVGGGARTPEADDVLASAAARRAAIADLADIANAAVSAHPTVEAGSVGPGHRGPDPLVAQILAQECGRRDCGTAVRSFDDLGLARPPIDSSHPLLELGDRLVRLRLRAWSGAQEARPAIDDLKVFAALGQAVAVHASAVLGSDSGLEAWRDVSMILRPWRTPAPASVGVVGHTRRVFDLLAQVAPGGLGGPAGPPDREVSQALRAAARITTAIAGWNADTLARLPDARPTARARTLSGELVTDHPVLVAAKLADCSVEMPDGVYVALREAYSHASSTATRNLARLPQGEVRGVRRVMPSRS